MFFKNFQSLYQVKVGIPIYIFRYNLDPFAQYADPDLWEALEEV